MTYIHLLTTVFFGEQSTARKSFCGHARNMSHLLSSIRMQYLFTKNRTWRLNFELLTKFCHYIASIPWRQPCKNTDTNSTSFPNGHVFSRAIAPASLLLCILDRWSLGGCHVDATDVSNWQMSLYAWWHFIQYMTIRRETVVQTIPSLYSVILKVCDVRTLGCCFSWVSDHWVWGLDLKLFTPGQSDIISPVIDFPLQKRVSVSGRSNPEKAFYTLILQNPSIMFPVYGKYPTE